MEDFADDNFNLDENGRKFSKWVENTVGKGEIARYKQFLLFPQCFQKARFQGASKGVIVWQWVTLSYTTLNFFNDFHPFPPAPIERTFENIVFVWVFMPYQQYFSYLTATVHKSMFPGLFLTLSQTTYFRLFQSEKVCRQQFQI